VHYSKVTSLNGKSPVDIEAFINGLNLRLLIVYSTEGLEFIDPINYDLVFKKSGFYHFRIFNQRLFLNIGNEIKEFKLSDLDANSTLCRTEEQNITILNLKFSIGKTSQRKPRIKRGEIINNSDNKVIYKWSDERIVVTFVNDYPLFETSDKKLILLNIDNEKELWNIKLDNGSFGQRILGQTEDVFFLQRAVSKPNLFNVLALEKSTGKIIWETENTHPYYCFDEVNDKLYGLGDKRFEVISTLTGEKALITQLDVNVFISSHLTYYSDGFLYFSSHLDNNIPVFGAVNVKSGKLEFIQELKIEGEKSFRIGLEKPIVVGNRLYVKDSLNTLHIFEKDQNATT